MVYGRFWTVKYGIRPVLCTVVVGLRCSDISYGNGTARSLYLTQRDWATVLN